MAPKKQQTDTENAAPEPDETPTPIPTGTTPEADYLPAELEALLEESTEQEQTRVGVARYERGPEKNAYVYLYALPADEFSLETVRHRSGGGKYQFKVTERGKYRGVAKLEISGEPKPWPPPLDDDEDEDEELRRRLRVRRDELEDLTPVEMYRELRREMRQAVRELRNPPAQMQQQDPATLAVSLMSAVQQMVGPYQKAMIEKLSERPPERDMDSALDMFRMGLELARDMNQGDGWAGLARSVVPQLTRLADHHTGATQPMQPNPPAGSSGPPATVPTPTDAPTWWALVAPFAPQLAGWARADKDPGLCAAWVASEVPDQYLGHLADMAMHPETSAAEAGRLSPELLAPYRSWLTEFLQGVAAELAPDDDGNEAVAGPELHGPPPSDN